MKAITFLEWCKFNNPFDLSGEVDGDTKQGKFCNDIERVVNFYSQPFKPEMITEVFEGWKNSTNGFADKIYTLKHEEFADGNTEWRLIFSKIHGANYWNGLSLHFPITLNDFISDCNRAGIKELTFKPEIANKYFEVNNG